MHWFRSPRLWIVLLVAFALVAGVLRWRMGPLVEVVEVRRADIVQSVVASGRLVTPARVALGSVLVGTVLRLEAREGAVVKAGQVLAVLKGDEQRAAVAQARGALAEAEARLAQLATQSGPVAEEGLHKAEAGLRLAREEAARTQSLFDKGFFSRSRLDEAQRTLKAAQADHDSAVAQAGYTLVAVAGGDSVPLVPYFTFGTEALSQAVGAALQDRLACLLANHGLVAAGTTVAHAMKVVQEVESLCHVYLQALAVGEPALLSADDMATVLEKFRSYGRAARS